MGPPTLTDARPTVGASKVKRRERGVVAVYPAMIEAEFEFGTCGSIVNLNVGCCPE